MTPEFCHAGMEMAAGSHTNSAVSAIALTAFFPMPANTAAASTPSVAAINSSNAIVDPRKVRRASSQTQDCVVHNIMRFCFRAGIIKVSGHHAS